MIKKAVDLFDRIFISNFGRDGSQKILTNFSWLFTEKVLRFGLGAIVGIWIAGYMGPEMYGVYTFAIVFTTLFGTIVGLGLHKIIVRELVNKNNDEGLLLGTSFYLILSAGIICSCLCPLLLLLLRPGDIQTLILVLILSVGFILQSFSTISYYFESLVDLKKVIWWSNLAFLIGLSIKIGSVLLGLSIYWFVAATTTEICLVSYFFVRLFKKQSYPFSKFKFDAILAKQILKDSYPLIISGIAVKIYSDVDQLMLRQLYTTTEAGVYAIAVKISRIWIFIPAAIYTSVYPNLIQAKKISEEMYYKKMQKLYNLVAFLSYCSIIIYFIFSKKIITYFLGVEYESAILYVNILALSGLFITLGGARTLFLLIENRTNLYMVTVIVGCALNIILNFIYIPEFGGLAACVTTLATSFIAATGINFLIPSLVKTGNMHIRSLFYPKFW